MATLFGPQGNVLALQVTPARGISGRIKGLLGSARAEGTALLIEGLSAIQVHTFGMSFAIDVAFCDSELRVLRVVENLRPWRITAPVMGARRTFELPAGTLGGRLRSGDILQIA